MCESVQQVAAHVIGCDATITLCGQAGNFELNVMTPIMALRLLEAIEFTSTRLKSSPKSALRGSKRTRNVARR